MNIKEAIYERHTVRRFADKAIPADVVEKLEARVEENNRAFGLGIKLVTGNDDALSGLGRLVGRGVGNYFILAGEDAPDLGERLGYCGADLVLYAQTLGLNTWWIGGMVSKRGAERNLGDGAGQINSIIAVGYGLTNGTPHKSKPAAEISTYEGDAPRWFADGVDALLHAPTAINRQAFKVHGRGNRVTISYAKGPFSDVDLGIGKYHFEVGAGRQNFEWAWRDA